jgi:hypothetical protein
MKFMRRLSIAALLLIIGVASASAEPAPAPSLSQRPMKEAIDANNRAAERLNILRLRALMKNYQTPPAPVGPAGVAPSVPVK